MCVPTCVWSRAELPRAPRHLTHTDTPQDRLLVGIGHAGASMLWAAQQCGHHLRIPLFLLAASYPVCTPQETTETVTVFAVLLEYQLL